MTAPTSIHDHLDAALDRALDGEAQPDAARLARSARAAGRSRRRRRTAGAVVSAGLVAAAAITGVAVLGAQHGSARPGPAGHSAAPAPYYLDRAPVTGRSLAAVLDTEVAGLLRADDSFVEAAGQASPGEAFAQESSRRGLTFAVDVLRRDLAGDASAGCPTARSGERVLACDTSTLSNDGFLTTYDLVGPPTDRGGHRIRVATYLRPDGLVVSLLSSAADGSESEVPSAATLAEIAQDDVWGLWLPNGFIAAGKNVAHFTALGGSVPQPVPPGRLAPR